MNNTNTNLTIDLVTDTAAEAALKAIGDQLTVGLNSGIGFYPGRDWNEAVFAWLRGKRSRRNGTAPRLQLVQLEDELFPILDAHPLRERIRDEAWRRVARYQSSQYCWDDLSQHTYGEVPGFLAVCQEVAAKILADRAMWHVSWDPDTMTVSARPGTAGWGLPQIF